MADLIDRQALKSNIDFEAWVRCIMCGRASEQHPSCDGACDYTAIQMAEKVSKAVYHWIDEQPTIEPKSEEKRGWWVTHKIVHGKHYTSCSNCNSEIALNGTDGSLGRLNMSNTNYCPFCGVNMRGRTDD